MRRLAPIVPRVAALLLLTLLASSRVAVAASESTCVNGGQQNPDIAAGKTALQRSPTWLGKRVELANLLEKAGCYGEAVHLLEEGQKYNPFSPTLQFRLRRARNMLKEEQYLALRASELAPNNTTLTGKLQARQSQHQALLKRCTDGDGDAALQACKSVLVKGAPNEFETTVRMALLQQSTNQASQALDSYIAANSLRHGDKGVALAILALLESTQRKDAIALAARGSSLVTLGRAHEALAPLRQAKALEPELPDIDQQIKTAETLVRTESTVHKERPTQVAAVRAEAEATVEPQNFSNVAEATRSN
jgi:tetratricopeptide (TPR) repeat protein